MATSFDDFKRGLEKLMAAGGLSVASPDGSVPPPGSESVCLRAPAVGVLPAGGAASGLLWETGGWVRWTPFGLAQQGLSPVRVCSNLESSSNLDLA